ncbi:MAG: hypothetical protein AB7N76_21995 [Planctomycetota bacterium]
MARLTCLILVSFTLLAAGCQGPAAARGPGGITVNNPFRGGSVEVPKLPASVEEFTAWRDQVATTPEGGMAVYVVALAVYAKDQELGLKLLTIAIDQHFLVPSAQGVGGKAPQAISVQAWRDRIKPKPYIARSYFAGTSVDGGYALPQGPLEIEYTEVRDEGGERAKVFVVSSGADSARPITLQKNNRGVWKAWEWSSLEVGVRPPKVTKDDDL